MITPTSVVGDLSTLIGDLERLMAVANKTARAVRLCGDSARWLLAYLREQGVPTAVERINRERIEAFTADQLSRFKPATAGRGGRYDPGEATPHRGVEPRGRRTR